MALATGLITNTGIEAAYLFTKYLLVFNIRYVLLRNKTYIQRHAYRIM